MNEPKEELSQSPDKKDLSEQANQLIKFIDIINMYPDIVGRRITGLFYISIAEFLSIALLVFLMFPDVEINFTPLFGIVTVVIMLQYAVFGMSLITRYENRRPAAAMVNNAVPPNQIIYVFKPGYQPFLFYVRPPLKYILEDDRVTADVHYLLLKQEDWERLENQPHILSRSPETLCRLPDNILKHFRLVKLE